VPFKAVLHEVYALAGDRVADDDRWIFRDRSRLVSGFDDLADVVNN
jgi:hypothetical protein